MHERSVVGRGCGARYKDHRIGVFVRSPLPPPQLLRRRSRAAPTGPTCNARASSPAARAALLPLRNGPSSSSSSRPRRTRVCVYSPVARRSPVGCRPSPRAHSPEFQPQRLHVVRSAVRVPREENSASSSGSASSRGDSASSLGGESCMRKGSLPERPERRLPHAPPRSPAGR